MFDCNGYAYYMQEKLCNRIYKCFVLGMVWLFVVICMQLLLSSNVIQVTLGVLVWTLKEFTFSYSSRLKIPITAQRAVGSAMYLSLVVLSAINYCIVLAHIIGQPAYIIMYLVHEWLDNGLSDERCCHDLDQSASTYHSKRFVLSGLKVMPCDLVFNKYLHIRFTASWCSCNR